MKTAAGVALAERLTDSIQKVRVNTETDEDFLVLHAGKQEVFVRKLSIIAVRKRLVFSGSVVWTASISCYHVKETVEHILEALQK